MFRKMSLLSIVLLLGLLTGCTRIGPGHAGIEINSAGSDKGVFSQTARTGWFFYNPMTTTIVEYQTALRLEKWTQTSSEGKPGNTEVSFTNKNNMVINADVAIAFSLDASKVPDFYTKFLATSEDVLDAKFTNGYLRNQVRNCLNDLAGKYEIAQIMGDNAEFLNLTKKCIQDDVGKWGVTIDQFGLIGAPRPPPSVVANINQKAEAEQISIKKQIELTQVEADAKKRIADAEGYAKAQVAYAEGDAKANEIRSRSITPTILSAKSLENQKAAIDKWDGRMPEVLTGGEKSNFLMEIPKR